MYKRQILLYSAYLQPELEAKAAALDVQTLSKANFTELFDALAQYEDTWQKQKRTGKGG